MKHKKLLIRVLKFILVIALVIFLFKAFGKNWSDVRDYDYSNTNWLLITFSGFMLLVGYTLFGMWWALVIRGHGEKLGYVIGAGIFFLSNLFRYIPGKMMQGVSMVYLANRKGIKIHTAISATFIQQILYILSGLTITLVLLPPELIAEKLKFLNYLKFISLGMILLIYPPVLNKIIQIGGKIIKKDIPDIKISFGKVFLYYLVGIFIWLINGLGMALFISAFKPLSSAEFLTSVVIFPTGYVLAFMTLIAPGGIGIREGIFAYLLKDILVPPLNIAVSAFTRVLITIVELVVVIPFLLFYFVKPEFFDKNEKKEEKEKN